MLPLLQATVAVRCYTFVRFSCIITSHQTVCARALMSMWVSLCFARCVYLAAMSSPFNIIFTIQSHYTSYSFMSSHINDFIIMCALLSFSLFPIVCVMFSVFVIETAKYSKRNMSNVMWMSLSFTMHKKFGMYASSKLNDIIIDNFLWVKKDTIEINGVACAIESFLRIFLSVSTLMWTRFDLGWKAFFMRSSCNTFTSALWTHRKV